MESFEISERDLEEENELFNDPESRRKRKRFTKEDAIYGIFKGSDSEDEVDYKSNNIYSKNKYNTGISFVKGQLTNNISNKSPSNSSSDDENYSRNSDSDSDNNSNSSNSDTENENDNMEEDINNESSISGNQGLGFGNSAGQGLGFGNSAGQGLGFGNSAGQGLGFGNSAGQGLGFSNNNDNINVPTEFSSSKNKKEKKKKEKSNYPTSTYKSKLKVDKNFGKFEEHTKGIGLKLLMKQGYVPGEGLGVNKDGITAPIDVKLRPKGQGLSFNNFDEMTENDKIQQKEYKKKYATELKAKGIKMDIGLDEIDENLMEEEENELEARPKTEAWKKGKKNRKKITLYKTVDEIIREESEIVEKNLNVPQPLKIIDMTKKEVRILSDSSQLSSDNKISMDKYFEINEHLPELRHNIKLITDLTQTDLMYILKQLKVEETKRKGLEEKYSKKSEEIKSEKVRIEKVKKIDSIIKEVKQISQDITKEFKLLEKRKVLSQYQTDQPINKNDMTEVQAIFTNIKDNIFTANDGNKLFSLLDKKFLQLESDYDLFLEFKLDRLLVTVIAPIFKKMIANWNPLEDRYLCLEYFIKWKKLLLVKSSENNNENDSSYLFIMTSQKGMTCFESLLYSSWLPKIRQLVNNDWDPRNPESLIKLLEEWEIILPQWLKNNIIEQLIIPKLKLEVNNWMPQIYFKNPESNNTIPLHSYLLPWLVVIDEERMHLHLFETVKNKLIVFLHNRPFLENEKDGGKFILQNLCSWLEVLTKEDFMDILTQCVLPELVRHLRYNFFINPAKQDIKPLMQVLAWSEFVPEMLMTKVVSTEFFPKWYKILAMWLKSGEENGNEPNYNEIVAWYKSWKDTLKDIKGLDDYWKLGLDMMNEGANCKIPTINSLSDDQPLLSNIKVSQLMDNNTQEKQKTKSKPQLSLKEYLEKELEKEDCLLEPSRIIHESGKTLYNIIKVYYEPVSKKKTIYNLYIDDGVLFVRLVKSESNNYIPIGINELIEKIKK
ncbi:TFP11-domain-containing protein [Piromyces finnis]|uniref:TFP11-domain-containing protein n=1 Tax=Piromyces finnis TaxID=1754191 RepID=A0A1Y1UUG5_9FUNG|nr:TFP11-domain-containing protein [Piromyces finnis]|eukprot:ORX41669.1 TFP11-domain-containing protein [Piromyces finnis]